MRKIYFNAEKQIVKPLGPRVSQFTQSGDALNMT